MRSDQRPIGSSHATSHATSHDNKDLRDAHLRDSRERDSPLQRPTGGLEILDSPIDSERSERDSDKSRTGSLGEASLDASLVEELLDTPLL